jgi:chromosome segregation ATPase
MDDLLSALNPLTKSAAVFITLVGLFFHVRWTRRGVVLGPTLLTTLGIFFCFLGIALGLLDFDPRDVRSSVPHLLQGIRTSFWASVVGIFWALTIKLRVVFFGEAALPSTGVAHGATVDDLAYLLSKLHRAIAGDEDSTLLSQSKLLRTDTNDRLDRLNTSFEKFAHTMAEANSKALIQALSEVIRDFNVKLTEQFGENFKQLNVAVERLVTWQRQYEQQLTSLIEQETATRKSMTEASLRYADLVNKAGVFSSVSDSLKTLLTALNAQREHLTVGLTSLAAVIDKASNGLPEIEKKILEMTTQIGRGVQSSQDTLGAVLKSSAQSIQAHNQELTKLLSNTLQTANRDLNAHVRQATEDTKKHVVALDKALEEELTKSLQSLARQLTALSERFVQDYTPLTDRLRQVVQMARA